MLHAPCSMHLCSVPACGRACVGTYGNIWELRALCCTSCCIMRRVILRCMTFFHCACLAARRFFIVIFALRDVFSLRFSRFKAFFHCDICAAGCFFTAILRCKACLRCVFVAFLSRSIHFPNHNLRVFSEATCICLSSHNIRMFASHRVYVTPR